MVFHSRWNRGASGGSRPGRVRATYGWRHCAESVACGPQRLGLHAHTLFDGRDHGMNSSAEDQQVTRPNTNSHLLEYGLCEVEAVLSAVPESNVVDDGSSIHVRWLSAEFLQGTQLATVWKALHHVRSRPKCVIGVAAMLAGPWKSSSTHHKC